MKGFQCSLLHYETHCRLSMCSDVADLLFMRPFVGFAAVHDQASHSEGLLFNRDWCADDTLGRSKRFYCWYPDSSTAATSGHRSALDIERYLEVLLSASLFVPGIGTRYKHAVNII